MGMLRGLSALFLSCLLSLPAAAERVPDFALIDQNGRFHQLSRNLDRQAIVIMLVDRECLVSGKALSELISLQRRYRGAPVSFQALVISPDETRSSLARLASELDTDLPFLLDETQLVTDALKFTHSGEVLVIDPARNTVLYRGGLGLYEDEPAQLAMAANLPGLSSHLHYVVHSVLRNEPFLQDVQPMTGRRVELGRLDAVRSLPVSYEQQIVPILEQRCVSCHRDGGAAPWSMDSHAMVMGWAPMIRETLLTRRMPPGQIDHHFADRYADVHHISDDEMLSLMTWLESGAGRDDRLSDPLPLLKRSDSAWELGEPDLIVEFPAHKIPATGVLDYSFVPIELGLTEDKWVSAYEFDVGDKAALHHIIVYTQDARQQRQNASQGGSRTNFGGYAPGRGHVLLDENTGIRLRRDMRFMIQFHYTTVGRELTDKSRLGLYFRDTPPRQELVRTAVMNGEFVIPPGAREFPVGAATVFNEDTYLYSFAPHMHYRGKHIRFVAHYPDGRNELLLSIPNFQHNWQMVYRLREPLLLPKGTRIEALGGFDNSVYNPINPDPGRAVTWGEQVWDEMFITWMRVSPAK
jgi:hypothetical protein